MRNWLKTALFVSAFSPALISVAASRYLTSGLAWDQVYYCFAGCFGTLCNLFIIDALRWKSETLPFIAKKIESNDALMLAFVGSYVLPFFAKAAEVTPEVTLLLLAVAAFVLWFSSSIPTSPLLRIFGYRFYKVESSDGVVFTIISQRELIHPGTIRQVKKISNSMLLEVT